MPPIMPIRTADQTDLDVISELGSRSLQDGPYAGIIEDKPEAARKCATWVMQIGKILLAEEEGKIVGLLGFIVTDHHFSGQRYASELMWYVLPEHRKLKAGFTGHGMELLKEAERMAKEAGAKDFVFTAPNDGVAQLYKRMGYSQLEVAFRKEL